MGRFFKSIWGTITGILIASGSTVTITDAVSDPTTIIAPIVGTVVGIIMAAVGESPVKPKPPIPPTTDLDGPPSVGLGK